MPAYERELAVALQAVQLAARICSAVQSQISTDSLEKKDKSPVTIADYASQAVICEALRVALPNDLIVAEEDAAELRQASQAPFVERAVTEVRGQGRDVTSSQLLDWIDYGNHDATAARYWTLDPIDGTKGFLRKEQFAISLALIIDGQIQVAALACPNLPAATGKGVTLGAVRGQGAFQFGSDHSRRPIQVSTITDTAQARVCESVEAAHSDHDESATIFRQLGIGGQPVRMDSQAKYAAVAQGQAEIYLRLPTRKDYVEKIWDHAGGVLVVEEAGGRVTDSRGRPLDFHTGATLSKNQGVVVTNGRLHERVLRAVERVLAVPDSNQ